MKRVLLINMPFSSVRYPSTALSLLKPLLEERGIPCDVRYANIAFQAHSGRPELCEAVCEVMVTGEWVFGGELFGEEWVRSDRGGGPPPEGPLVPDARRLEALRRGLPLLRRAAGSFLDAWMDSIPWDDYSVVGFTSVFSQQVASLALARRIKERWPDKIVVFGGANCEEEMGRTLLGRFPFVDWVFNGEADLAFPEAVARWFEGSPPEGIPGVLYRRNGEIAGEGSGEPPDLDRLPYPDFDDYFAALGRWAPEFYDSAPLSLEWSRGCWWGRHSQCVFCGLNCHGLKFRSKSGPRAEAEIKDRVSRYGVDRVVLTDSIVNPAYFKTLFPALADWGGISDLFLEARANLTRKQVRLLRAAGVTVFQPGVESLDTEILALMRKGTTLLQNVQFLKWSREYGLYPTWNLLYGFPGENPQAYRRMADLLPSLFHLFPPMDLSPVLLVRFSPLFENREAWGLKNVQAHSAYRSVYPFDRESLDGLAYFFTCDFEGRERIQEYIGPLRERVEVWKQCWRQRPPVLLLEERSGGRVVLYDGRPYRRSEHVELSGAAACAYLICDAHREFGDLCRRVRAHMGDGYPGDAELRERLEALVRQRFMLREGDRYLSLATRTGMDRPVSEEWA